MNSTRRFAFSILAACGALASTGPQADDAPARLSRDELAARIVLTVQQEVAEQARTMEASLNKHVQSVETSLNESIAQGIGDKPDAAAAPSGAPPSLTSADSEKPKV